MKYLPLYYKWMETGNVKLPSFGAGLCAHFEGEELFYEYIYPFRSDPDYDSCVWCETHDQIANDPLGHFNELRQNVVLFLAAMNGEL